ncbi:DNA-directed RNA polymerase II subunit rpb1 [Dendroctonus ponderosae]|uniref:Cuticle protein 6 n=1 Tax=Dendroctonus ponderosae TaxID=77166 RepID=A0AAR5PLG4_DENPD|nr:DNA-directed RNA polymerase II subunit rpb1 [Dendroctonus ponderosae]
MKNYLLLSALMMAVAAQNRAYSSGYDREYTTPVPILKQIDRHNDDGSYSYGYENADGTYKIETKYPTGEVYGKYGYIDDTGKLREVEYGASQRGFEPAGTDVTVAPPTLTQNAEAQRPLGPNEEDDGQYREDPAVYYKNDPNYVPKAPSYNSYARPSFQMSYAPAPTQPPYSAPVKPTYAPFNPPAPTYAPYSPPAPTYSPPQFNDYYNNRVNNPIPTPAPHSNYAPQMSYWNPSPPAYPGYNAFQGSPAQNVDIWSGSYTVNYRR